MSQQKIASLVAGQREILLEVGSGKRPGRNGWLSLDMSPKCDINHDLRNGIPFPDGTVSKIYSSHFLEHLTFNEAQLFLKESRRVLVAGGEFLICVPNARLYAEAYLNPDIDRSDFIRFKPAFNNTNCRIDYLNYIAYMASHHKYMFDQENLQSCIAMAGFNSVQLRDFDPDIDLAERDYESIYASARK